jgi:hypothetical protein
VTEIRDRMRWPSGRSLLKIGADVAPSDLRNFSRWCGSHRERAHRKPDLLAARIFTLNADWIGAGVGQAALTLFELGVTSVENDVHETPPAPAPASMSKEFGTTTCTMYSPLDSQHAPRTHEIGSAILHVTIEVDPKHNARFLDWYVEAHVPAILEAPGMLGARRFEAISRASEPDPADSPRRYCTLYEMTAADVISRPETQQAARRGACPRAIEPYRKASNQVYDEVLPENLIP